MTEWYRTRWLFSFAVLLAVLLAVLVLWLVAKGEGEIWPKDFEVFYKAGERAAAGEDLYRPVEDGFYRYKYSPAAALMFIPLTLMPLWVAGVVFRVALIPVFLLGLYLAMRIADPSFPQSGKVDRESSDAQLINRTVLLAALVLSMHYYSELTLGQVNQIVIVAGLGVALLIGRSQWPWLASALLAASVYIKPFLLIFLPYLVLRRRWRELAGFALFSGILFLLPAFFYRNRGFIGQTRGWMSTLADQVRAGREIAEAGNHTLASFITRLTHLGPVLEGQWTATVCRIAVLLALALLVLWLLRRGSGMDNREALDFALLMLTVPLLIYLSENGFGLAELAVVVLLVNAGKFNGLGRTALVAGLALLWVGTLVSQISGHVVDPVLSVVHDWSLITAGTLALFLLLCLSRYRQVL